MDITLSNNDDVWGERASLSVPNFLFDPFPPKNVRWTTQFSIQKVFPRKSGTERLRYNQHRNSMSNKCEDVR